MFVKPPESNMIQVNLDCVVSPRRETKRKKWELYASSLGLAKKLKFAAKALFILMLGDIRADERFSPVQMQNPIFSSHRCKQILQITQNSI